MKIVELRQKVEDLLQADEHKQQAKERMQNTKFWAWFFALVAIAGWWVAMDWREVAQQYEPINHRWEFFIDKSSKCRWRRLDHYDDIVGAATKGFTSINDCIANAQENGLDASYFQTQ